MRIPLRIPPASAFPFDVVGCGLNSLDLLAVVAEHPAPDTKQRLQRVTKQPGGQIATALRACARLGWRTRYIGRFGADEHGRLARAAVEGAGVDVAFAPLVEGAANQFAIILVDARSGGRCVLWDRHPGIAMGAADVDPAAAASGRMLIVDCHETAAATRAATLARAAGIPTVVDVEKVRPGINDLLATIDAVIAATDFPAALTGHDEPGKAIRAIAHEFGSALVTVTLGPEGSLTFSGGREIRTPAFPVDVVDTTGAGDVFRGGFVAACLRSPDGELEDALAFASAAAALNCRALGAGAGLPTEAEIDALIRAGFNLPSGRPV